MARKKGFIFTVLALAILALMLASVSMWVRTFEQSEINSAQRFKGEAIRSIFSSISDKELSDFANASGYQTAYVLANYSSKGGILSTYCDEAPVPGYPPNPCTGNVEYYAQSLMENGSLPPTAGFNASLSPDYAISEWKSKVSRSAGMMGFNVTFSNPKNFTFKQIDPWHVRVYFEMDMRLSDFELTMRQSKTLRANATFDITGFPDPMIERNEHYIHPTATEVAQKQIFRVPKYTTPASVRPVLLADDEGTIPTAYAWEGTGWFFGPTTESFPDTGIFTNGSQSEIDRIKQYVLVSHSYDSRLPGAANFYGAVLLLYSPNQTISEVSIDGCMYNKTSQENCLNCLSTYASSDPTCPLLDPVVYLNNVSVPVLAVIGNATDLIPDVLRRNTYPESQRFILINSRFTDASKKRADYRQAWDVTKLRDMAICGFYVHDDSNSLAPSFFQRMLASAPSDLHARSRELGIESFVVGQWAGGSEDVMAGDVYPLDEYSRLDYEFYSSTGDETGIFKIKGMMGCKSAEMCDPYDLNATKYGVGKFRLSTGAILRYGIDPKMLYTVDNSPISIIAGGP